jgi:hypothetical protein
MDVFVIQQTPLAYVLRDARGFLKFPLLKKIEAVATLPFGVIRLVSEGVKIGNGEHVGQTKRLADIALPLDFPHVHNIPRMR